MSNSSYQLDISVREYTSTLLVLALVLVTIHIGLYVYNYQAQELPWLLLQLFDLDEENNIPTWVSSFLLLNCAFFLYIFSNGEQLQKKFHWRFLAAGFLLLAIDEVAGLHESFNSSIEMNWAIPGAILVLLLAVAFVPFLLSLPRKLACLFILSGFLYVSGAIIVEVLSEDMDSDSLGYMLAVAVEEGLEMIGALLFLTTVLNEMRRSGNGQSESEPEKVAVDVSIS